MRCHGRPNVLIIIIFSTDAFARRECSLFLPPVKEGNGIIQLRYAPRSYPEVNLFVTFYSAFKVGAGVFARVPLMWTSVGLISS